MSDAYPSPSAAKPIIPFLARIYGPLQGLAYPVVRLFAGLMLMPHGAQKLFGAFDGPGLGPVAENFGRMFGDPGMFWAVLVGGTEFFGGFLIAIGLLTRVAGIMAAVLLWMATFTVHMPNGFFMSDPDGPGYEFAMLWAVVVTAITVKGGGNLSVDKAIGREF